MRFAPPSTFQFTSQLQTKITSKKGRDVQLRWASTETTSLQKQRNVIAPNQNSKKVDKIATRDDQQTLDFIHSRRKMKLMFPDAIRSATMLADSLKSLESCDEEVASLLKKKINPIITAALWEVIRGETAPVEECDKFFTFLENIDSAFLTPSSRIIVNNIRKKCRDISENDWEVIISTLPDYLQEDQIKVNYDLYTYKRAFIHIPSHYLTERTKALILKALMNGIRDRSSQYITEVLLVLCKLQYRWSDFPLPLQEIFSNQVSHFINNSSPGIFQVLINELPIMCFDCHDMMNASSDSPLMRLNVLLLREISKRFDKQNSSVQAAAYFDWLRTLPVEVQQKLLSSAGLTEFPKLLVSVSSKMTPTPEQQVFMKECKQYLLQHVVEAEDMKHRKIVITRADSCPEKVYSPHLTVECDGKVVACIHLLKQRIKGSDGEMKLNRVDSFREYLCNHAYGYPPIIRIEYEDYSQRARRKEMLNDLVKVLRDIIESL